MPESFKYTPKSFDSIDPVAPPKVEAAEPTIPTYENGNRIAPEASFKNKLVMEQAQSLVMSGVEKVKSFGAKTGELFMSAAEKTGGFFGNFKGMYDSGFSSAYEKARKEKLEIPALEEVANDNVAESTTEVAEATSKVEELGHNVTLEAVAGSRAALAGAAEKSAMAGAENAALLKVVTESIGKYLKKKLRELFVEVFGEMRTPESKQKAEHAEKQMKVVSLLDELRGITPSSEEATKAETVPDEAAVEEMINGVEAEAEVVPVVAEQAPEIVEEAPAMPKMEDEGIVQAFAKAAEARQANDNESPVAVPKSANEA
jgi:predicted P-loop ATPase/GTPase